jgi:hypothetical protein
LWAEELARQEKEKKVRGELQNSLTRGDVVRIETRKKLQKGNSEKR